MIVRDEKTIATHPYETIKELLILQGTRNFGEKAGLNLSEAIDFMERLEEGGIINEKVAETLETGGLGNKNFWLNLQRIYDEKCAKINKQTE